MGAKKTPWTWRWSPNRIPIVRVDADGTVADGTAEVVRSEAGTVVRDFRDLDGEKLDLPAGSRFEVAVEIDAAEIRKTP